MQATRLQRAVVTAGAGVLLSLCIATLQTTYHLGPSALDVAGRGGRDLPSRAIDVFVFAVCAETLVAFIVFCGLTIVWGIFQPTWAARFFNMMGKHVWHVLILFILGFVVLLGVFAALTSR